MAQTEISTEGPSQPTSSPKHGHGLAKSRIKSEECLDAALPAQTYSESGPSGENFKHTGRSSERKQPARASKRDIVFVRKLQLLLHDDNTEPGATLSLRPCSRVMARVTRNKVYLYQDGPQLAQLLCGNGSGRPRERVMPEISRGPQLVQ
jgi:hypothetical protein